LGVVREQATIVTYAKPFSITVVSDRDYTVYKEMRGWFDTLAQNANPFSGGGGGASQRISYYSSITRPIILKKLEQSGGPTYFEPLEVIFNNSYPVRVGEISLNTDGIDSFVEFNVDFTYDTFTLNS